MTRKCKTWNITKILPQQVENWLGTCLFEVSSEFCCYNMASSSLHLWLNLRVLEFKGATFWTLGLEMFNVGQFYSCRYSVLQQGCWLFSSVLHMSNMCYSLGLQECACCKHLSLLFVVGHCYGHVMCEIQLGPTSNRNPYDPNHVT